MADQGISLGAWLMGFTCVGGFIMLLVAVVVALWAIQNSVHAIGVRLGVAPEYKPTQRARYQAAQLAAFDAGDRALRASVKFGVPFDADDDYLPRDDDPFALNISDDAEDGE